MRLDPVLVTAAAGTGGFLALVAGLWLYERRRHALLLGIVRAAVANHDAGLPAEAALAPLRGDRWRPREQALAGQRLAAAGLVEPALALTRLALDRAARDPRVALAHARALAAGGRADEALSALAQAPSSEGAGLALELARQAEEAGELDQAAAGYTAYLGVHPRDLGVAIEAGEVLCEDRPAQVLPLLVAALAELRRQGERGEFWGTGGEGAWRELHNKLTHLQDEAASRAYSAERAIDGLAATGQLNPHAGVNYRLVGYSILVRSDREPRRVAVPSQGTLEAAARDALARDPTGAAGHEDLGLWHLREGRSGEAEAAFRRAIDLDPDAWPAYVGLGTALDAPRGPARRALLDALARAPDVVRLNELVAGWHDLTEYERSCVRLAAGPARRTVAELVSQGGRVHLVSLDARTTDVAEFAGARGVKVEDGDDGRVHDAIGGLALGPSSVTRIDELYRLEPVHGFTLAHELGHQVLNVAGEPLRAACRDLMERYVEVGYVGDEYGLTNEDELFATGYERLVLREAFPGSPFDEVHETDVRFGLEALVRRVLAGT